MTDKLQNQLQQYLLTHKDEHIELMEKINSLVVSIAVLNAQHETIEDDVNRLATMIRWMFKVIVLLTIVILLTLGGEIIALLPLVSSVGV